MTEKIRILAIGGTWAKKHEQNAVQWYQRGSLLYWFLRSRNFSWLIGRDGRMYDWTTRLVGHQAWRRVVSFFTRRKWAPSLIDWQVAGSNLFAWVCPPLFDPGHWLPAWLTYIWAHSHGGNVVFFACADGMKVDVLVTFCTPVRGDMAEAIKRARPNVAYWIEVHSDACADKIQRLGEVGDGVFDLDGVQSFNDLVDPVSGHTFKDLKLGPDETIVVDDGHSKILNDPRRFDRLLPILKVIKERHDRHSKAA
jgi:hypothetical protein